MPIPVVDLFAGPGGLGEGFSSLVEEKKRVFKIRLSIEKDELAHKTLELRAFFREFAPGEAPDQYYAYLAGKTTRKELFKHFPKEAQAAATEAWHAELGHKDTPNSEVDNRIRTALGTNPKEWVLIGGPPCQAYSLMGRSKMIGEKGVKEYDEDPRHFLYRQYLRIIAAHRPSVFVMENVKGLLSAKVKEQQTFQKIIADLQAPLNALPGSGGKEVSYKLYSLVTKPTRLDGGFEPGDFVVRAENYGIPQARHRLILLGIRSDIQADVRQLTRSAGPATLNDAIDDLPPLRSGLSKEPDSVELWSSAVRGISHAEWLSDKKVTPALRTAILKILREVNSTLSRGGEFIPGKPDPKLARKWFLDERLKGFCNHSTRSHIRMDLHRYLFVSAFATEHGRSPGLEDFPTALLPNHENVNEAIGGSKFNDRFRVQMAGRPSTTVVSHISKDGHYYIHHDPAQCRSLTVREAARLQTFPDNYFFEGPRTAQYHQVGNAVPPLLAYKIAKIVADLFR